MTLIPAAPWAIRYPEEAAKAKTLCLVMDQPRGQEGAAKEARDLFVTPWFRAARHFAETRYDAWGILSVNIGLAHPDAVLGPYSILLGDQSKEERTNWGKLVTRDVMAAYPNLKVLDVLANEEYCRALTDGGLEYTRPLRGLKVGAQMKYLADPANLNTPAGSDAA